MILIGYRLTVENANEYNLVTGTRYLNIERILPFENQIADYVQQTGNHVLYCATSIYEEDNLLASGVIMEEYSGPRETLIEQGYEPCKLCCP